MDELVASACCRRHAKSEIGFLPGGFAGAVEAFDALRPEGRRTISTRFGDAFYGTLADGVGIMARPGSSMGHPTLQIDRPETLSPKRIVIRFAEGDHVTVRDAWYSEQRKRQAAKKKRYRETRRYRAKQTPAPIPSDIQPMTSRLND